MRNIKRILAMSLATVMLCASMAVGSAASFNDADKIVNTEAVTITTGLGIFAGTTDGNFDPTGTVTRAQMAAVIVKMLYGPEINADQFKGAGKFSDVADFEGGWAEGYVNLCSNLGIVAGYGDGTFKPGAAVTTAEATTMIINALKVDAGNGTWPLTVMAKAEEMKLFAELAVKPLTNNALTRDELASVVFEAIQYSPSKTTGYSIPGSDIIFDDFIAAYLANKGNIAGIMEVMGDDSIANEVFNLKSATGIVEKNQATADQDYTTINGEDYNIETDIDVIGHNVTVYFESTYTEKDPGVTYAIVDENKTVIVAQPEGAIDSRNEYRAAFGNTKKLTTEGVVCYKNYIEDGSINLDALKCGESVDNKIVYNVPNGTYVIDEDTNAIIAYHAPAVTEISIVEKIVTTAGKESIKISGINNNTALANTEDNDVVVEYDGIAEEDLVAVTKQGALYVVEKLDTINGIVTSQSTNKDNGATILTISGTKYTFFAVAGGQDDTNKILTNEIDVDFINKALFNKEHTFYLTNGKLVGYSAVAGSSDVSDVIYVVSVYDVETKDAYGQETTYWYAQGVDMNGKEVNILIDVIKDNTSVLEADNQDDNNQAIDKILTQNATGFYTFEKCGETEGNKYGIMTAIEVGTEQDAELTQVDVVYADGQNGADVNLNKITPDSKRINVANNGIAYLSAGTKLIKAIGSGATIETTLSESVKYTVKNSNTEKAYALVSLDDNNNMTVEAIVVASTESISTAEDIIFVTADQTSFVSANAIGKVFEVYNAKTGELIELTIDGNSINAGFYEYSYDETEQLHSIGDQVGVNNGYYVGASFEKEYNGMITFEYVDDQQQNVTVADWDASKAIIVDIRDEDEIDASDWAKIETLSDMVYTEKANGGNADLILDIVASEDADDALVYVIYVTDIQAR